MTPEDEEFERIAQRHIADLKKSSKAIVEDAAVRAVRKVMAEFDATSDPRLMEPPPEFIDALKYDVAKRDSEAQSEPVAWMHPDGRVWTFGRGLDKSTFTIPLYTTPPHRKPLTDDEIDKLPWEPHEGNPMTFAEGLRYFARAIEAAHGIKE